MAFADSTNVKEATYQLRACFVPWEELRRKQGTLTASQLQAVNSGITSGFVALIAQNAADINTLRGLVTAQVRLRKVTALPDEGESNVIYLVPDAGADPTSPDQCTEYIWADDRYEIVGKTSVTPGNGTLTINVNGQAAGSFSADQSTDTTIGITVPLAVSDLQNDSGFQTASDVAAAVAALSSQLATVAFSGSYDDLTDKPSYPGIGNGTLTIAQNGTQVGSFTANQDSASTINIITPTKTSDLQNDSDFVDASDLATKQAQLTQAQLDAVNSGITDTSVAQIEVNRVAIQGKQTQLTQTQLNAVNSGITSGKVALFDAHLADTDAHVTAAQKAAWTAKQDALTEAQLAAVNSGVTVQKVTSYDDHVADADIHVTAAQKAAWTAKQDALTVPQLNAVNSGITSTLVTQIGTNQSDIATKANDSEVVHLAGAETITGDKTFTGAVVTHNITPETDNTYSLGSSTLAWSSVYAQTYYYNGTEFLDKFCTLDTEQNIPVRKNYLAGISMRQTSITATSAPAVNTGLSGVSVFDNSYRFWGEYGYAWRANGDTELLLSLSNWTDGGAQGYWEIAYGVNKAMTSSYFIPRSSGFVDLGTSSYKWKTLNGVNPGALGMPDLNSYITLDTTNWDTTGKYGADSNFYTPTTDGWLSVIVQGTVNSDWVEAGINNHLLSSARVDSRGYASVFAPCRASVACKISIKATSIFMARFYPCLGNV